MKKFFPYYKNYLNYVSITLCWPTVFCGWRRNGDGESFHVFELNGDSKLSIVRESDVVTVTLILLGIGFAITRQKEI